MKTHIFHSSVKEGTQDKDVIYMTILNMKYKATRCKKISNTTVGWTASGNFREIISVLGFSCSFVIFISKALIALMSFYLPDDVYSFIQC